MNFQKKQKIKKWETETFDDIIVFIHKIFSKICREYGLLRAYHETQMKEMFLNSFMKVQLEEFFGVAVINEGINAHGKTDIMIIFEKEIKHIIECKRNINGSNSIKEIYRQINRHTTSNDETVSLIMFCENKNFQKEILNIINWINENVKLVNKPIKPYKNYKNVWKDKFIHDYGHILTLHFACYHVFFDKNHANFN